MYGGMGRRHRFRMGRGHADGGERWEGVEVEMVGPRKVGGVVELLSGLGCRIEVGDDGWYDESGGAKEDEGFERRGWEGADSLEHISKYFSSRIDNVPPRDDQSSTATHRADHAVHSANYD